MHKTLNANGYEFAYTDQGSGETMLFVHGSLLDYRYWTRELAHFSKRFRAIALSRRHHWPTPPKGEFVYTGVDQTDDVIAFIDALDIGPVHLIGHSYGGYIAARIACLRPDLLKSLVLMEPGGPIEGEVQGRSRVGDHSLGAEYINNGEPAKGVAHFLDTVCFEPKWEDSSEDYKAMTLSNALTVVEQVREIRPTLEADALSKLTCPILLMIGARSISPFPETLDRFQELIPHAQRVSIENASHMMNIDNSDAFLEALSVFMDETTTRATP